MGITPIMKGSVFLRRYGSASTDILTGSLRPTLPVSKFLISADFSQPGAFTLEIQAGTIRTNVGLNASGNLNADKGYSFEWPVRRPLTYNLRYGTRGTINELTVFEQQLSE